MTGKFYVVMSHLHIRHPQPLVPCGKEEVGGCTFVIPAPWGVALTSIPLPLPCRRRYFICDKKLASLGWTEKTGWEEGLRKTVDWYLKVDTKYWDNGNVEQALVAHPSLQVTGSGAPMPQ
jgi:hypothetical protein